ncbi:TolC family protein [Cytophagales bacterium LB-30]|uniref:TolC family protein n=1 Tax=Shiella aurantiaca TaxID=3058365 RepID=A0ABT8F8G3_9BACT|nr:TolC family protein [Shiella aurantiaca]MDN4166740.1 TolC family protein [Shiella aurantiaca]
MRYCLIFIVCLLPLVTQAQVEKPMTWDSLLGLVLQHHPVALQAEYVQQSGEQGVRRARGAFDPQLFGYYDQKQFKDTDYYRLLDAGLKVPTWFGVELKTGFEQNQGVYVNPEATTPTDGLLYAGISLPLAQGLLMDDRRASLRQAQLMEKMTEAEQLLMLNRLVEQIAIDYYAWWEAYYQRKVYEEALALAKVRLEAIRAGFLQGDRPAIDTVEAYLQWQTRLVAWNEAQLKWTKTSLTLSNHLWYDGLVPMELEESTFPRVSIQAEAPMQMTEDSLLMFRKEIIQNHPELQQYQWKIEQLGFEQRLKAEKLKPKVNLSYNFLSERTGVPLAENVGAFNSNDYKWGLTVSMPLLLREGRGDWQITKLKVKEAQADRMQKWVSIENKWLSAYAETQTLYRQAGIYSQALSNYQQLLNAENRRLEIGESNLFMVNAREMSLISAQIQWAKVRSQYEVSRIQWICASGRATEYLP